MITANSGLLLTIAIVGVYLLLLILSWVILTPKPKKKFMVEILNDGNVLSNYLITLVPYNPAIKYHIKRDGVRLEQLEEVEIFDEEQVERAAPRGEEKPSKAVALQKREPTKLADQASNAAQTGRKAIGLAGAFASVLGILGTILPGSAGRSLKARSTQIRNSQTRAGRKLAAPRQAKSQIKALQSSADQISGGKLSSTEEKPAERASGFDSSSPEEINPKQKRQKRQKVAPSVYRTLVEELSPGKTADLELSIIQKKRNQIEPGFLITLESLQQPLEDNEVALTPVRRQSAVNFDPIASWRWLPPVVFSLILTAALIWSLQFWIGV